MIATKFEIIPKSLTFLKRIRPGYDLEFISTLVSTFIYHRKFGTIHPNTHCLERRSVIDAIVGI